MSRARSNNCNSALLVLCKDPSHVWCVFLSGWRTLQRVFLVIDNNGLDLTSWRQQYPRVEFVQIDNQLCATVGMQYMGHATLRLRVMSWDKALYFVHHELRNKWPDITYVWFCEEDVFFHSEHTLLRLDHLHPTEDLLCEPFDACNPLQDKKRFISWSHWRKFQPGFPPPYANAMMCICRMSMSFIDKVAQYAAEKGRLQFLEAFIPSFALHHGVSVASPDAFQCVTFRAAVERDHITQVGLYHPVKQLQLHSQWREYLGASLLNPSARTAVIRKRRRVSAATNHRGETQHTALVAVKTSR